MDELEEQKTVESRGEQEVQAKFSRKKVFSRENLGSEEERRTKNRKIKMKTKKGRAVKYDFFAPTRAPGAVWRERKSKRKREKIKQTLDFLLFKFLLPSLFFTRLEFRDVV